jgi:hypothetical protein
VPETTYGLVFLVSADIEVAERVERRVIVLVVRDDVAILYDGSRNLALSKVFLSRTHNLCFIKAHQHSSVTMKWSRGINRSGVAST